MKTIVVKSVNELREIVNSQKENKRKISLVPTMGALHKGHQALIDKGVKSGDFTIVSIFVNPIQFGENEDYKIYPRTLDKDIEMCENLNVNIVFAPDVYQMYGIEDIDKIKLSNNFYTYVCPPYFYTDKLCGKSRIGHFDGVCTVVLKLFNMTQCDVAVFGQKDAQQIFIIKKMVNDLNLNVDILTVDTVRDENGLAISSRNKYLDKDSYNRALVINKALKNIKSLFESGICDTSILFDEGIKTLNNAIVLEYLEFVDCSCFEEVKYIKNSTIVAMAARVNNIRLIDNIILEK